MLFPKTLALIIFLAPLVHLKPLEVSPNDIADEIDCDCEETGQGGCVISQAARPGRACRCFFYAEALCLGMEVECLDPTSLSCQSGGDTSLLACQQGGGDCGGYVNDATDLSDLKGCDCKYLYTGRGGCVISRAARPGRECKCFFESELAHMCFGKEVECIDPKTSSCQSGLIVSEDVFSAESK